MTPRWIGWGGVAIGWLAFAGLIALGARLTLPMAPVPMTMQSLAVLLAGAVLGGRGGAAAASLYLTLAALGLPILADGASGPAPFSGATAGYLFAFPVAAWAVGKAIDRWSGRLLAGFGVFMAGHLLILLAGAGWLATVIGLNDAVAGGFMPFLIGAAVKSALGAACVVFLRRRMRGRGEPTSPSAFPRSSAEQGPIDVSKPALCARQDARRRPRGR